MQYFIWFVFFILLISFTMIAFYIVIGHFMNGPYAQYKRKTRYFTMEEISSSIMAVCNLQFMIYDENRFREAGPRLNNASFDNYYHELSRKCLESLSDEFYEKASMYLKEEAIAIMISEIVRNYLTTKLGIDESANTLDEEV